MHRRWEDKLLQELHRHQVQCGGVGEKFNYIVSSKVMDDI